MEEVSSFFGGNSTFPSLLRTPQNHSLFTPFSQQPQLIITDQKTHSEEIICKNGFQKTVHIVVKNSPFHFQLGLANSNTCKIDFSQVAFDAHLIYDCEGDKEVDFVKVKPMEFKSTPSENGKILETELRIKVLTSQHEDMLFKVRIVGSNPITREEIPGMSIISQPIKVISKPEQLKKKQSNKKRNVTDLMADTINRIEKKQEEQKKLIEKLIEQQNEKVEKKQKRDNLSPNPSFGWEELEVMKEKSEIDFEESFSNLVKSYNAMKPSEKPEIIRKLIRNSSARDTERLSELLDLFWTEGLQKEFGSRSSARDRSAHLIKDVDSCNCVECPHKAELERIDEFYKEFLSTSGVNPPSEMY